MQQATRLSHAMHGLTKLMQQATRLSHAMHGQNINLPVCVCVCVRHTFCQLAYRSDPSKDFYS